MIEGVVRCNTFLNVYVIWEDKDYFYFKGYNQLDAKVNY